MMRKMILILLMAIVSFAAQSKIVYLRLASPIPEGREFYVGERVELKYSLTLLSGATLSDVEFIPNKNASLAKGIKLLNPKSKWIKTKDGNYESIFIYKIKSNRFAFPTLRAIAVSQDGAYVDQDEVSGKKYEAIALSGERYSGVVARSIKVSEVKTRKYDEWNNIVNFNLLVDGGNLEDFKLKGIEKQGFNDKIIRKGSEQSGVFYCVIPSSMKDLRFTFFNLKTLHYEEKTLPILVQDDRVSTQSDLGPKNNFLILENILFLMFALILFATAFYFRRSKVLFWCCLALGGALLVFWLFKMFGSKEIKLKPQAQITIFPTQNSTLIQIANEGMTTEVIGERGEFYKIKFEDSRIGWVRKNDCQ